MVENVIQTLTCHHRSLIGMDSLANRLSLLFFFIIFLLSLHLLFIVIFDALFHHRYTSSSSLLFLFIIIIALIGISSPSFALSSTLSLSTSSSLIHFVSQMLSKRAKYSAKTLFLMRYSEICLIGRCLICGAYQQRNEERKVGTFQIMP